MNTKKSKQDSYRVAFDKAAALLKTAGDLNALCLRCGAVNEGGLIHIPFFNQTYTVKLPEVVFEQPAPTMAEQILILHYLTSTGNQAKKGDYITFKNLPGAHFYNTPYRKRGPNRILKAFSERSESLLEAGKLIQGKPGTYGDVSVELDIFPKIKAIIVMHRGDDEFPPELSILYRDDIINYLTLEDVAVTSGLIANRII